MQFSPPLPTTRPARALLAGLPFLLVVVLAGCNVGRDVVASLVEPVPTTKQDVMSQTKIWENGVLVWDGKHDTLSDYDRQELERRRYRAGVPFCGL